MEKVDYVIASLLTDAEIAEDRFHIFQSESGDDCRGFRAELEEALRKLDKAEDVLMHTADDKFNVQEGGDGQKVPAKEKRSSAKGQLEKFPVYAELIEARKKIRRILSNLSKRPEVVAQNCQDIHGIPRERISAIVGKLDQGAPIEEAELTAEPSIYGEIRNYLERQGITDRISFERALFSYDNPGPSRVANWYRNCGVRGLFPKNLVEIAIGRKLEKPLTEADLVEAGNKLFGDFDKEKITAELKKVLADEGINSRAEVLKLIGKRLTDIAKKTSAGSATILFRIIAGSRPRLLSDPMNVALANYLFPAN
jgi:hypothetical protein